MTIRTVLQRMADNGNTLARDALAEISELDRMIVRQRDDLAEALAARDHWKACAQRAQAEHISAVAGKSRGMSEAVNIGDMIGRDFDAAARAMERFGSKLHDVREGVITDPLAIEAAFEADQSAEGRPTTPGCL